MATGRSCKANIDCSSGMCSYAYDPAQCVICKSNGSPESDPYRCCGRTIHSVGGKQTCAECVGLPTRNYPFETIENGGGSNLCPCIKWEEGFEADPRACSGGPSSDSECCEGGVCNKSTLKCGKLLLDNGADCAGNYDGCSSGYCKEKWVKWWQLKKNRTEKSRCKSKAGNLAWYYWILVVFGGLIVIGLALGALRAWMKNSAGKKPERQLQQQDLKLKQMEIDAKRKELELEMPSEEDAAKKKLMEL